MGGGWRPLHPLEQGEEMRRKRKKKKKELAPRNVVAAIANLRGWGAGHHGDKRKEASKKACRGKAAYA